MDSAGNVKSDSPAPPTAWQPDEGERSWLLRALGMVGSRINLEGDAPPGPGPAADRVVDEHYQTIRAAILPARGFRRTLLPGEATIQQQVDSARERLVRL